MLTIVTFKWKGPVTYRSKFTGEHVNVLASMIRRHYKGPHKVVCYTDDPTGIDTRHVEPRKLWDEFSSISNPSAGERGPSCYRRLRIFRRDAKEWLGERIVSIDLDVVVTGNLGRMLSRKEDFVIWGDTSPPTPYNGSLIMFTAGARPELYEEFNPEISPALGKKLRYTGSDQAWISARLGRGQAMFGRGDGVYSFRNHILRNSAPLPLDAKLVMFHGVHDPWGPLAQRHEWVRQHWL